MDWRRAGSPTYGRRRSPAGMYSAPASPTHPLGPSTTSSPLHPLAARSKARAAAALAQAMARPGARGADDVDDYEHGYEDEGDDVGEVAGAGASIGVANGRYDGGGRSPLNGGAMGYGGRSGAGVKNKYFGFALPKI